MSILDVERRQQIVALVESNISQTVAELSERFGVSPATIRRDLQLLSTRGLVERAHGGVVRRAPDVVSTPELPLQKRAGLQAEEKQRIGQAAATHVRDSDTIIITAGTTTARMIPHLAERKGLTVITNALNIVQLLANYPDINVIVLGGTLRHSELTTLGSMVEDAIANLRATTLFMGSSAIHPTHGLSADNLDEARCDQLLMTAARNVVLLADHSKFGQIATVRVAPVTRIDRLITDSGVAPERIDAIAEQGVLIEVV